MKHIALIILSGGLLFAAAAPATAHDRGHYGSYTTYHYNNHFERQRHMPRWLKRNRGFRHWYHRSSYRYDRGLSWTRVYNIYRYQHRSARHYRHRYSYNNRRYRY